MKYLYKFHGASWNGTMGPILLLDLDQIEIAFGNEFILAGKKLWLPEEEAIRLNFLLGQRIKAGA